jgi:hypothetical protein
VNEPLMRLWQRVLAEPLALAADYEQLWHGQLADPPLSRPRHPPQRPHPTATPRNS